MKQGILLFTLIFAFIIAWFLVSTVSVQSESSGTRGIELVDGRSPVDYVAAQTGRSWAVVIGIDEYRDPKIPKLKYTVADARAIGEELERRGY